MKIHQARNERWWSDGQGYFTIFYILKTIQILNYDAHDAIKNTNRHWFILKSASYEARLCWATFSYKSLNWWCKTQQLC